MRLGIGPSPQATASANLVVILLSLDNGAVVGVHFDVGSLEGASIMLRAVLLGCIVLGCVCVLPGCIAVGGETEQQPTVGRELTDLKMALDRGAITPGEYEAKKSDLLARR